MTGMDEVADDLLKLYNGLKTERDGFGGTWRFARWFLIPHKVDDFFPPVRAILWGGCGMVLRSWHANGWPALI